MGKSRKIGVLVDTSIHSTREVMLGIAKYSAIHRNWELHTPTPSYLKPGREKLTLERLCQLRFDGVIMSHLKRSQLIIGLPIAVQSGIRDESVTFSRVEGNGVEVGKLGAEYLIARGFKQLAFCSFFGFGWDSDRFEGFHKAGAAHGCEVCSYERPPARVLRSWTTEKGFMGDWLKSLPKPIGLMATNDYRARQVLDACEAAEILVPEGVAVLGVDNDEIVCNLARPPLSSVNLNLRKTGYEMAELLDRMMSEKQMPYQHITIMPTHVVTRESTDIMAISDLKVADAVRFIRDNHGKSIQVADVARAVAMTTCSLDRRFRSVLGRSVFKEISSARLEYLCVLLLETDWRISRIAAEAGFSDTAHMIRRFREVKGMTPLAYRNKYGT